MPAKKRATKSKRKTEPATKKSVASKQAAKKRTLKKPVSKPVSPRKKGAIAGKTSARAEPASGRTGTMPSSTLVAMAIASLEALRADIDANSRRAASRGRAASKPKKLDKTLATALEQLQADYSRVLGSE